MKNDRRMKNTLNTGDEDDWETADIPAPTLRPSAPAFVPRSSPAQPSVPKEEDEWFATRRPVSNRQIWDSANSAAPIIAPAPQQAVPPPIMQILRRNPVEPTTERRSGGVSSGKTLEEREEEYKAARERIFGGESKSGKSSPVGDHLKIIPSQVRRSPVDKAGEGVAAAAAGGGGGSGGGGSVGSVGTSGRSPANGRTTPGNGKTPPSVSRTSTPGSSNRVVRQPMGPVEGGGFGR